MGGEDKRWIWDEYGGLFFLEKHQSLLIACGGQEEGVGDQEKHP